MMKLRWMAAFILMCTTAAYAAPADEIDVKGKDGEVLAKAVLCSDCQSPAEKDSCHSGAEQGWLNGKPCGKCLLDANGRVMLRYPYDLHFTGTLVDPTGAPSKNRFVKAYLPNGWGVRTKTSDAGTFRLMLGATADRKGKEPLVTDLGTRVNALTGDAAHYSMYILPTSYKPCAADAAAGGAEATDGKKQKKSKKK